MSVASIAWVGRILRYPCLVKLPPGQTFHPRILGAARK